MNRASESVSGSSVSSFDALFWPRQRLADAMEALARDSGLTGEGASERFERPPAGKSVAGWLDATAAWLDLETEQITVTYGAVEDLLHSAGPCILQLPDERYLLLAGWSLGRWPRRRPVLLGPDLRRHRVDAEELAKLLREPLDTELAWRIDAALDSAEVPATRRPKARKAMLKELLSARSIAAGWLLRSAPHRSFAARLRRAGTHRRFATLLGVHAVQYVLWLTAWWLVGRAALGGTLATGWMAAWVLLLMTLVPLRMWSAWLMGDLALGVGTHLKSRFLYGALRLDRDDTRYEGVGSSLGRVLESEAVESLALSGGLIALTSVLELPFAAWVIWQGTAGGLLLVTFGLLAAGAIAVSARFFSTLSGWTEQRLRMTYGLIEKMVGHRTRLAQESKDRRHEGETAELDEYLERMEAMDRQSVRLLLVPRLWLVLAIIALAPALLSRAGGSASGGEIVGLAVAVGGILLMQQALTTLVQGLSVLSIASVSWRQVAPLFRAGATPPDLGLPALHSMLGNNAEAADESAAAAGSDLEDADASIDTALVARSEAATRSSPVLEARGVGFRYRGRSREVLQDCNLRLFDGDRLLLEGPSGGGKSTLAALLVGLREPTTGMLLLEGADRGSIGLDSWRQRVLMVPQFHDNHVLTETFAFNALMGRRWPPEAGDLEETFEVCQELGLGELLERMPSGLQQMVGDTGWQLSHGERSRLFLARALLQQADVMVLDESFAALDPENLERAMDCALRRGTTVLVIAHP